MAQNTTRRVAVIGAGIMGHSIAQLFAQHGFPVALFSRHAETLERAQVSMRSNLDWLVERGWFSADGIPEVLRRVEPTTDLAVAVKGADLIVETVAENLGIKHQVLEELERHCPPHAVISSNSSSYQVASMASALRRRDRFLVTHFWNPPHIVPLVEVVQGQETSNESIDITMSLLKAAGKVPALVRKDIPGFVGNRLQHALRREALAIVAHGVADVEDVDLIARFSFGLRSPFVGLFETMDLNGLDTILAIQKHLLPDLDRSTDASPLLIDRVERGELGVKSRKGFYDWSPDALAELKRRRDEGVLQTLKWLDDHDQRVQKGEPQMESEHKGAVPESTGTATGAVVRVAQWKDVREESRFAGICHRKLDAQNMSVVRYVYQPGSVYPPHSHAEEQVTVVLSGEIEFDVGGRQVLAGPDTVLVIPPWVVHGARVRGDVPVVSMNLLSPRRTQPIVYQSAP